MTAGVNPEGPAATADRVASLLSELTLAEKLRLLGGADFWHTQPIERVGIPALHLSDGPSGVRGARSVGTTSVSFPCGSAIGATFDVESASSLRILMSGKRRAASSSTRSVPKPAQPTSREPHSGQETGGAAR